MATSVGLGACSRSWRNSWTASPRSGRAKRGHWFTESCRHGCRSGGLLSGLSKIAPHIGSVVARELGQPGDTLPAFLSLNCGGGPGQGYLEPTTAPFYISPSGGGLGNTTSPVGATAFDRRYGLLLELDAETRAMAEIGPVVKEMEQFNLTARTLMYNSDVDKVFVFDVAERARYGTTSFGNACITARNLLRSRLGARFIQITSGGWDMHTLVTI